MNRKEENEKRLIIDIRNDDQGVVIDWISRSDWRFLAPSFQQTIESVKTKEALTCSTLEEFFSCSQSDKTFKPDGFIFHASRCGSTVLTQMLSCDPNNLVLSEPDFLGKIFSLPGIKFTQKISIFRKVIDSFLKGMTGSETRLYIKFCMCNWLPLIRLIYPETPWIYVYRDPLEILKSNLNEPPPWLAAIAEDSVRAETFLRHMEYQLQIAVENVKYASAILNYSELHGLVPQKLYDKLGLYKNHEEMRRLMSQSLNQNSKKSGLAWKRIERHETHAISIPDSIQEKYQLLEKLRLLRSEDSGDFFYA